METVTKIAAAAIIGCAASLAVKKSNPELSFSLLLALSAVVLFSAADAVGEALTFLRETAELAGASDTALSAVLKTSVIAAVSRFTSDACRDAGALSASSAVETAGSAAAVCAAVPLMRSVIDSVRAIL